MSDEVLRYTIRFSARARRDMESVVVDYAEYTGDHVRALQIYNELERLAGTLEEAGETKAQQ